VLKQEEERFAETLENGMGVLEGAMASEDKMLDGETVFKLYDTFGFPLDLTADIARERGITVDFAGFENAMQMQRERARAASKFSMGKGLSFVGEKTEFVGYDSLKQEASIVAIYKDGARSTKSPPAMKPSSCLTAPLSMPNPAARPATSARSPAAMAVSRWTIR
jgi:alanyl-tRNA synthetase